MNHTTDCYIGMLDFYDVCCKRHCVTLLVDVVALVVVLLFVVVCVAFVVVFVAFVAFVVVFVAFVVVCDIANVWLKAFFGYSECRCHAA